jgi:hypothetical protein
MKLSEFRKKHQEKYPNLKGCLVFTSDELLSIDEFDNQPDRSKREEVWCGRCEDFLCARQKKYAEYNHTKLCGTQNTGDKSVREVQ